MKAVEALLSGCIDYAGLFPPAGLDLSKTVREFCGYRLSDDRWALGRLVLPAGAVAGFRACSPSHATDWPLSLLLGPEWENDVHLAEQIGVSLDVVEFKLAQIRQIAALRKILPASTKIYFEVPGGTDLVEHLIAIADVGAYAKIRTGGITEDAIPSIEEVIHFLSCCALHKVPFKATAGLHHAIRAVHPLTYKPGSDRGLMHGFINLILAASTIYLGGDAREAATLLDEGSPAEFRFSKDCVHWRDRSFTVPALLNVRQNFFLSFGSCSFTEPLAEMRQLRWM